jgi:uncharacterized protein YbaR (Trm112 family)
MKKKLKKILVCPLCKGPLDYQTRKKQLVCSKDNLAFPIRNGIPVLLRADAKKYEQGIN